MNKNKSSSATDCTHTAALLAAATRSLRRHDLPAAMRLCRHVEERDPRRARVWAEQHDVAWWILVAASPDE